MGLSYYLAGRPAEAIAPLEEVQTWYPSANVDAAYILGICYVQTKDYPNARKAFAKMFAVPPDSAARDRKSTRLNSSHLVISYAVFCLKKKKHDHLRVHCCKDPRAKEKFTQILQTLAGICLIVLMAIANCGRTCRYRLLYCYHIDTLHD